MASSPFNSGHVRSRSLHKFGRALKRAGLAFWGTVKHNSYSIWREITQVTRKHPKTAFLVALVIVLILAAKTVRTFQHHPLIIVSAFEVPTHLPLPYSGKIIANAFSDELQHVIEQASTFTGNPFSSTRQYPSLPDIPKIPVQTTFGLEIKGISVDQLMSAWNKLAYDEQLIAGDLLIASIGASDYPVHANPLLLSGDKCKTPAPAPVQNSTLVLRVRMAAEGYARYWQVPIASTRTSDLQSALNRIIHLMTAEKYPAMLGRVYLAQNRFCDALAVFEGWEARASGVPEPLFYIGYTLARMEEYELAKVTLQAALNIAPNNSSSLGMMGYVLLQQGNYSESIRYSTKAHRRNPIAPNFLNNIGYAYAGQHDYEKAIGYYRDALAIDGNYVGAEYNWANALEQEQTTDKAKAQENIDKALTHYQHVLTVDPKFFIALDAVRRLLVSKRDYQGAEMVCKESSVLNPGSAVPLACLGDVLYEEGQVDGAVMRYQQAANLDPVDPQLHYKLGQIAENKGDFEKAVLFYGAAAELQPKDLAFVIKVGNAEWKLGDRLLKRGNPKNAVDHFGRAITYYCKAVDINQNSSEARYNLSLASSSLMRLQKHSTSAVQCSVDSDRQP